MQRTVTLSYSPIGFNKETKEVRFMGTIHDSEYGMVHYRNVPFADCWKDLCRYHPRVFEYISREMGTTPQELCVKLIKAEQEFQKFLEELIGELREGE